MVIFNIWKYQKQQYKKTFMEPQKNILDPKLYIKQESSLLDYQCSICYFLPARPVRCRICRKPFCMNCVSDQKKIKDKCPFRCSTKPFSIQLITNINMQFKCPYSSKCQSQIDSITSFYNHDLLCEEISPEDRQFKINMREYKCLKGQHMLEFFIGTYEEMCNELQCSHCKSKKLCRSICRPCDERFCIQCRPVPASKKYCPIGHDMIKSSISNLAYLCDICGLPTVLMGQYMYDDYHCNFGICELCYHDLPHQHPQVNCLENNPEYCFNSRKNIPKIEEHQLTIRRTEEKKQCSFCKRMKKCPQTCLTCQTVYCLQCKTFLIQPNNLCLLQHELQKTNNNLKLACDRCQAEKQQIMIDTQCSINLCIECVNYGKSMKSDKERYLEPYFCEGNHLLTYNNTPANLGHFCAKCKHHRLIKFFCSYCTTNNTFCVQCFPPPKTTLCYLGHKMVDLNLERPTPKYCHYCGYKWHQKAKNFLACYKCLLFFCHECYQNIQRMADKQHK